MIKYLLLEGSSSCGVCGRCGKGGWACVGFQWAGQVDEVQEPDKRGKPGDTVATPVGEKII